MLHPSQYCEVPGNTISDAATTLMDAITFAESTHAPPCTLSLDFTAAFDMISHTPVYLMPKIMTTAWNSSHSYKRYMTRPSARDKLMANLQDHFPYNFALHKAVQWPCFYSLLFRISWYICWSHIVGAAELDIGQRNPRYGIHWRFNDFCDVTCSHLNNRYLLLTYEGITAAHMKIRKTKLCQQARGTNQLTCWASHIIRQ